MSENEPYLRRLRQYRRNLLGLAILLVAGMAVFSYLNGLSPGGSFLAGALGIVGAALLIGFGFRAAEDLQGQIRQGVAERLQAEEEAQQARQEWEEIFQAIGHPTMILDPSHRVILANRATQTAAGMTQGEIQGKLCYEVFHGTDAPPECCPLECLLASGHLETEVMEMEALEGWFMVSCTPVLGADGRVERIIHIATDITERKQAEEKIEQRSREMATLLIVGQALTATLDLGAVLQTSVNAVLDLLGLGSGAIYLLEGETLHLAATTPPLPPQFPEEFRRAPLADHPHIRQAITTGEPVVLSDAAMAELTPAERAVSELRDLRSIAYVPLVAAEQAVGVCILGSVGEPRTFSEVEIDWLRTLAAQTALAVESARLHASVQRRAREMAALYETSLEINAQRDVASLLPAIVERAADLLGAPMGGLYLVHPDGETLELTVSHNLPGEWVGTVVRLGEGISGRVAQTKEPLMVEDHRTWEGRADVYADGAFRRVLGVPLIVGDRVIGVLDFTDTERAGMYSEEEVRLASLFADQAAIAIENARLYEEARRHAAELEKRVAERTAQLSERAAEIAVMNRALANLLEDLQTSNIDLSEATDKLREVNEELEAFASSVSHDLRAPVRAMQGFARALLEDAADQLDETGTEYAQRIVSAGQRMDTMIQDLLAYSRVARADLELQSVPLEAAVAEALAGLKAEADEKGAQIAVEGPLPDVVAYRATLAQIIGNLVSNALKFTTPGVAPQVCVRAEERDDAVRLWVEDNGIGIAPEHQQRVFRVFERLHGVEAYPGTGIGLAIVRKGAERMGGSVGVESEVGEGSRFWIELRKGA